MTTNGFVCVHCGKPCSPRSRRLCYRCYFTPAIRPRYPIATVAERAADPMLHGLGLGNRTPTKQPEPTSAQPGSPTKVEVLEGRMLRGEHLWHQLDRGMIDYDLARFLMPDASNLEVADDVD